MIISAVKKPKTTSITKVKSEAASTFAGTASKSTTVSGPSKNMRSQKKNLVFEMLAATQEHDETDTDSEFKGVVDPTAF